jgi:2-phosphosulfolactate phosphatase
VGASRHHRGMNPAHTQHAYRLRFDWGLSGAQRIGADADVIVVIDVLSFTTTLSVALDSGSKILPYRWNDASAAQYALEQDAVLAVGRSAAAPGDISLSPGTIRTSALAQRIVLPSPNGSTISLLAGSGGQQVIGAALRNFSAVANWIAESDRTIAVVAAGERWNDGSLRPAVEDLWGAGAVIGSLLEGGMKDASPEASAAAAAYAVVADDLPSALRACASGRELVGLGFAGDVEIAAEVDLSRSVPVLRDGVFA